MAVLRKITFQVIPKLEEAFENMRKATSRSSIGEVVRDALNFYEFIVMRRQQGDRIFIGANREDAAEVRLEHLDSIKKFGDLSIVRDDSET